MKMEINNFSGISNAAIEYNGFTIITGINSTGKSTLGKTLYFTFNEFKNTNEKYIDYMYYILERRLKDFLSMDNTIFGKTIADFSEFSEYLKVDAVPSLVFARVFGDSVEEQAIINTIKRKCNDVLIEMYEEEEDEEDEFNIAHLSGKVIRFPEVELYKRFEDALNMSKSEAMHNIVRSNIRQYFDSPYNKVNQEDVSIKLKIKNEYTLITSKFGSHIFDINNYIDIKNNVFYFDDDVLSNLDDIIYALDREPFDNIYRSRLHPNKFIRNILEIKRNNELENDIERAAFRADTDEIRKKINNVYSPYLLFDNGDDEISPASKDVALGFKIFILLDKLLEYGIFMEKDVVILDEPEIHIHPSLQVDLAQMLYELREALDLTMIVNTHSPFFVEALSTITDLKSSNPKQTTNLYTMNGKPGNFISTDVTENPTKIFDEMAEAYKKIDDLKAVFYKNES